MLFICSCPANCSITRCLDTDDISARALSRALLGRRESTFGQRSVVTVRPVARNDRVAARDSRRRNSSSRETTRDARPHSWRQSSPSWEGTRCLSGLGTRPTSTSSSFSLVASAPWFFRGWHLSTPSRHWLRKASALVHPSCCEERGKTFLFFLLELLFCYLDLLSHLDDLNTFSDFTKRVIAQHVTTVTVV